MKSAAVWEQILLCGNFMYFDNCEKKLTDLEGESRTGTKRTACWSNGHTSFLKKENSFLYFSILLTVHLNIFILIFNNLMH